MLQRPALHCFARTPVFYRSSPRGEAALQLVGGNLQIDDAAVGIDRDRVALVPGGEGAAVECLSSDVGDHEDVRSAAESAAGDQRDIVAETAPTMAPVKPSISRVPGPPRGAFAAYRRGPDCASARVTRR